MCAWRWEALLSPQGGTLARDPGALCHLIEVVNVALQVAAVLLHPRTYTWIWVVCGMNIQAEVQSCQQLELGGKA